MTKGEPPTAHINLCHRLQTCSQSLRIASESGDLDRLAQLEHTLKSCVMELVALLDIFDGDQGDVLHQLEYASESLRIASQNVAKHRAALRQKITSDKHLRLIYSKGRK